MEGYWTGKKAIFLRFAKCNLQCSFCDTSHKDYTEMTSDEIIKQLKKYNCDFIVVTGGEPLLQYDNELSKLLHNEDYFIQIESNGTIPIQGNCDWLTISPKSLVIKENILKVREYKLLATPNLTKSIINYYKYANDKQKLIPEIYIQPIFDDKESLKRAINIVKQCEDVNLSIQTHKYIGIE